MTVGWRQGAVGLQLLLAVVLGAAVMVLVTRWLHHQQRSIVRAVGRAEVASALARAPRLLATELRGGAQGRDWRAFRGDSLALRAFRGSALVCTWAGSEMTVGYVGDRRLDPAKDSVLALDADGRWVVAGVVRAQRTSGSCHGRSAERWVVDRATTGFSVVRVFERGVYSLTSGALRYRRGRAGRQPLTYSRFDSLSSLRPGGAGGVRLDLHGRHRGLSGPGLHRGRTLWARERP